MIIVQLRGTSGSGKSTAMRTVMETLGASDPLISVRLKTSPRAGLPVVWGVLNGFRRYRVSNHGEFLDAKLNRTKRQFTGDGYSWVTLQSDEGDWKYVSVHKAVLEVHGSPQPTGKQSRHLNGIKTDNAITNLVWGTALDNSGLDKELHRSKVRGERQWAAVFDPDIVREIRRRYTSGEATQGEMAREFGVTQGAISHIIVGRNWKHVSSLDGWEEAFVKGRSNPLYYRRGDVYILGSYRSECGGCDSIGSARVVYETTDKILKSNPNAVLLQEGLLLSEDVKWTTLLKSSGFDVRCLFLVTPVEQCIDWIKGRRKAAGNEKPLSESNTRNRVGVIERARVKLEAAGVKCRRCSARQAPGLILDWLREPAHAI